MQNPLLNDYVKKQNRGFATSMQKVGETIGEITAFFIMYEGVHYTEEARQKIFFIMTGLVLVCGILVTCLMVRDKKV